MTVSSIISFSLAALYLLLCVKTIHGVKLTVSSMCQCAIVIALTMILESLFIPLPTGAVIPLCSPVPLMLFALLAGRKLAVLSGLICGFLSIVLLPLWQPVHIGQIFLEHLVCFSALGFADLFANRGRIGILAGCTIAMLIKTLGHVASGVVFFSQNAWDGFGPWAYSLSYHASSKIPLMILCLLVMAVIPYNAIAARRKSSLVKAES